VQDISADEQMTVRRRRCPVKNWLGGQKLGRSELRLAERFGAILRAKRPVAVRVTRRLARFLAFAPNGRGSSTRVIVAHQLQAQQELTAECAGSRDFWYQPCPWRSASQEST